MQKTLNHTGRKKLKENCAQFSFVAAGPDAGAVRAVPEFNVAFDLDASAFPPDARLYVEAYHKETRQRFDFGTVANIQPPPKRTLDEIDLSGPTLFRVLVVDESGRHGLLLASGEGFSADADDDNRSSLMSIVTRPLGQKAWSVSFERGGKPELCLNDKIPDAIERMKSDSLFQSLILPAALKEVLTFYAWNGDEDGEHVDQWMALARIFAEPKPDSDDPNDLIRWVDEVVEGFVARFAFCDKLVDNLMRSEIT